MQKESSEFVILTVGRELLRSTMMRQISEMFNKNEQNVIFYLVNQLFTRLMSTIDEIS